MEIMVMLASTSHGLTAMNYSSAITACQVIPHLLPPLKYGPILTGFK